MLVAAILVACSLNAEEKKAPAPLVPIGDPGKGRALFEDKRCSTCHTVEGAKFPEVEQPVVDLVHLAGANNPEWTRDLYAREIMDPQHTISIDHQKAMVRVGDRVGEVNSPMVNFNKDLSVQDLIDITTFLEEKTKLSKR